MTNFCSLLRKPTEERIAGKFTSVSGLTCIDQIQLDEALNCIKL